LVCLRDQFFDPWLVRNKLAKGAEINDRSFSGTDERAPHQKIDGSGQKNKHGKENAFDGKNFSEAIDHIHIQ
jgi:hypothetical protein